MILQISGDILSLTQLVQDANSKLHAKSETDLAAILELIENLKSQMAAKDGPNELNSQLTNQVQDLGAKLAEADKQLSEWKRYAASKDGELAEWKCYAANKEDEHIATLSLHEKSKTELAANLDLIESLKSEIAAKDETIQDLSGKLVAAEKSLGASEKLQDELTALKNQTACIVAELEDHIKNLYEDLAAAEAVSSYWIKKHANTNYPI